MPEDKEKTNQPKEKEKKPVDPDATIKIDDMNEFLEKQKEEKK